MLVMTLKRAFCTIRLSWAASLTRCCPAAYSSAHAAIAWASGSHQHASVLLTKTSAVPRGAPSHAGSVSLQDGLLYFTNRASARMESLQSCLIVTVLFAASQSPQSCAFNNWCLASTSSTRSETFDLPVCRVASWSMIWGHWCQLSCSVCVLIRGYRQGFE